MFLRKVNTGGVVLNAFELLTATYAAENFRLRDDWYGSAERSVLGAQPAMAVKKCYEAYKTLISSRQSR